MATLSWYLNDTAEFLRDTNYQMTSQKQMTRWINAARRQAAYRSGCIRCLITGQSPFGSGAQAGSAIPGAAVPGMLPGANPNAFNAAGAASTVSNSFQTIVGAELYPFSYANSYLQQSYSGVKSVVDVIDVSVSWGGIRPTLNWLPWDDMQAYCRSYNIGVFSYPFVWSTNGDGETAQVWLFPGPTQALEMEWDAICVPMDLVDDNTYDAIPGPFENSIKYYSAYLCYLSSQRFGMAQIMLNHFNDHIGVDRVATDRGKVPDYYYFDQGR